jgi:hypothetical protein
VGRSVWFLYLYSEVLQGRDWGNIGVIHFFPTIPYTLGILWTTQSAVVRSWPVMVTHFLFPFPFKQG